MVCNFMDLAAVRNGVPSRRGCGEVALRTTFSTRFAEEASLARELLPFAAIALSEPGFIRCSVPDLPKCWIGQCWVVVNKGLMAGSCGGLTLLGI